MKSIPIPWFYHHHVLLWGWCSQDDEQRWDSTYYVARCAKANKFNLDLIRPENLRDLCFFNNQTLADIFQELLNFDSYLIFMILFV